MTEIKDIPIKAIQYMDDAYPREKWDQETVNRYRQAIDRLPPIQATHEYILIDGYHRLMAHRIEQREMIKAEVEQIGRDDVLWEATRRNATKRSDRCGCHLWFRHGSPVDGWPHRSHNRSHATQWRDL